MIYDYLCQECGEVTEAYRMVKDRDHCPRCHGCGAKTIKVISPGRTSINVGKGHRIPGLCTSLPGDPVYVKNKRHFRELCKERNAGTPVNL